MTLPPVYPILDTESLVRLNVPTNVAAAALLDGGARILQFRHKGFWSSEIVDQAAAVEQLCQASGAIFVINDRADYAALLWAALHVGQDDISPVDARVVIGDEAVVGYSTHNLDQLAAAETAPVDYLAFGPIFPTVSKQKADPVVGLELLRQARDLTRKPLVAIGGITQQTVAAVWDAGADSVALISALLPSAPLSSAAAATFLRDRMAEWTRPF